MDQIIKRDYKEASRVKVLYDGQPVEWRQVFISLPDKGKSVVLTDVLVPPPLDAKKPEKKEKVKSV